MPTGCEPDWYPMNNSAHGGQAYYTYWDGQDWIADYVPHVSSDGSFNYDKPLWVPTR